jgi:long-chain acyl-CoA synthetase
VRSRAIGPETVVSRGALLAEVARSAAALARLGVRPGDRVGLLLPNCKEAVFLKLALWSLGASAVVLSPHYTIPELARCLGDAPPKGMVALSKSFADLAATTEPLPKMQFWARVDGGEPSAGSSAPYLYDNGRGDDHEVREPAPEIEATIHFTYKGLGHPLGAIHRYQDYARCADALVRFYRNTPAHTYLCALPLSHIYSLVGCILVPLYAGSATAIVKHAKPQHILKYARTHGANVICLVPALYRLLAMCARRAGGIDFAGTHWLTGGAYFPPELYEELGRELGVQPFQGYGLSEALVVTASNWEANRPGTLGVPIFADTEIAALSEDGDPLPPGEVGEIAIRAPTLMSGYAGRPEETARLLRDGRLLTGDLGCVDGDGFLHFVGRRRRFAKVAGFMVDLREVENAVRAHAAIETCAASSEPDEIADEMIRASVTLKPGAEVGLADLVDHCRKRLAFYKVPKGFRFLKGARQTAAPAAGPAVAGTGDAG